MVFVTCGHPAAQQHRRNCVFPPLSPRGWVSPLGEVSFEGMWTKGILKALKEKHFHRYQVSVAAVVYS